MLDINLDAHKLAYHPKEVSKWLYGEKVYPLSAEISLCGSCNHRCTFCGFDYKSYANGIIDKNVLHNNLKDMAERGLKSLNFAGDGEPLLHKDATNIINETKELGIDVGLSTNGVFLTSEVTKECARSLTWVRFSTSAATNGTFNKIHRGKERDLDQILDNMAMIVSLKRQESLPVTIGVQLVLIPDNFDECVKLGEIVKAIGVDYYTVKSFGMHPFSKSDLKQMLSERNYYNQMIDNISSELRSLQTDSFNVFLRLNRANKQSSPRQYMSCLANPFFTFIDSIGGVWPCCVYLGKEEFCFGSLQKQSFIDVWESDHRMDIMKTIEGSKLKGCIADCRLDEMNRYLHRLLNPQPHDNFI